jgi:hypothetical protein
MSIVRLPCLAAGLAGWLCVSLAAPPTARAQDAQTPTKQERQAAREAYDKGTKAFEKGDFVTALDSFVKANALIPSVQAMFWIARAQDSAGKVDAAIEAYEAVSARADYETKLSEDKKATVRERLAALKAQKTPPTPPAPPLAAEPPPAAPPAPAAEPPPAPPPVVQVTALEPLPPAMHDEEADYLPKRNLGELGLMGGALFVSNANNLAAPGKSPSDYDMPVWQVGARAAFFPEKVFGIEAEYAHGFGAVKGDSDRANFDVVRGHLLGQLPGSRAVPFVLLGGGIIRSKSDLAGSDTDFLLDAGVGLKVMATKIVVPRLDARLGLTQKKGGGFADGLAAHPELLLGVSFVLGR